MIAHSKFFLIGLLFLATSTFGQEPPIEEDSIDEYIVECEVYEYPDKDAEFPGGYPALYQFIEDNLEVDWSGACFCCTVYVQFLVNRDGRLTEIKLIKGVNPTIDEATLNLIHKMPNWVPAEHFGKKVRTRFILPLRFRTY